MNNGGVLASRIALLDDDAQTALMMVIAQLVTMLEAENGAAVTFLDIEGDGHLAVLALGNQDLVDPLIGAAAEVHRVINQRPEGPLQ
jgi:hypothetical protein